MEDSRFVIDCGVLVQYEPNDDNVSEIVIPQGIAEVGEYAFLGRQEIKRVVVPEGVKRISQRAFWGCTELREIVLPAGLEDIRRFAFLDCGSLESITIPGGVKNIGNSAFRGCDMMRRAVLPDSVENIGESAFSDCVSLKEINIPKGLKIIKKRVFSDCIDLVSVVVPEGIAELDDYAFECCSNLSRVVLPESLKKIGRHTFSGCSSLREIHIPESVGSIGSSAFYKTPLIDEAEEEYVVVGGGILIQWCGKSENAVVPDSVKVIGERAFAYCEGLKSVTVPEGVREVGDYAFEHCTALENVILPQSLKKLGSRAFVDCAELSAIKLPENISRIGSDIFYGTRLLDENNDEMMIFNEKYLIRYTGQAEELSLPDSITIIAEGAFTGCDCLKRIRINEGTAIIGEGAFRWCGKLERAVIPDSVGYIGKEAFVSSEGLHAYIAGGERSIGENAFAQGAKITFTSEDRSFTAQLCNDIPAEGCEQLLFRFAAAPSKDYFDRLERNEYKIPAAICYADTDDHYSGWLRANIREAVCYAADSKDNELLDKVLSFGFLSEEDAGYCVNYAIEQDLPEQQVTLMRFKNRAFGGKDIDKIISEKFEL